MITIPFGGVSKLWTPLKLTRIEKEYILWQVFYIVVNFLQETKSQIKCKA